MREIKFRVWSNEGSEMINWNELFFAPDLKEFLINDDDAYYSKIMQYTGIKDKKGKEIYDGDVIMSETYGIPMTIEFDEKYASFYCHESGGGEDDHLNMLEAAQSEVIGNIYENPELLND